MIPFRPLVHLPINTYNKLSIKHEEGTGILKKILSVPYNITFPVLATVLAMVVSGIGLIAVGLVNLITYPFYQEKENTEEKLKGAPQPPVTVFKNNFQLKPAKVRSPGSSPTRIQRINKIFDHRTAAAPRRVSPQPPLLPPQTVTTSPPHPTTTPQPRPTTTPQPRPTKPQPHNAKRPLPPRRFRTEPAFVDLSGAVPPAKQATKILAPPPHFNKVLPQTVDDDNFPITFQRASQSGTPLEYSPRWPKKIPSKDPGFDEREQLQNGTNSLLYDFYSGTCTIPETGTSLWGLFRQAGTKNGYTHLEDSHDVVQLMLPTREASKFKTEAPTMSKRMIHAVQTDKEMASRYLFGVLLYLQFWGGVLGADGKIHKTKDFTDRATNVRVNDHNHKRMARMVKSLTICGFGNLGAEVLQFMRDNGQDYGLVSSTGRPSSYILNTQNYTKQHNGLFALNNFQLTSWTTPNGHYLNSDCFASDHVPLPENLDQEKLTWFTTRKALPSEKDPIFSELLQWDENKQKWNMPHLHAPQLFCTEEQQKEYERETG